MYVAIVPNRNSPPAILLRESYREGGKVKNRTLANLSGWEPARVEALRQVLKGATVTASRLEESFDIVRSLPHGHVAAVLGTLRQLKLERVLGTQRTTARDLVVAMMVARIITPASKLATARAFDCATQQSSLADLLGVEGANEDRLYQAMDWLLAQQERIEARLAKRHLDEGTLALYDLTSTYFEGHTCPLAKLGHSRDGQKGKAQIVFGLLTNSDGCPVAVEVFAGNTGDPKTVAVQVEKLRARFGLQRVVMVGDRGMLTSARIREDLKTAEGVEWITALRGPQIRKLVDGGSLQLSLFDERDLAEITDPGFPGERLVVCRNPLLAAERARKREELLAATERDLARIVAATQRARQRLCDKATIALRVGRVLGRYKMKKHFRLQIEDGGFAYSRDVDRISKEAALDGIYVIRTSVPATSLSSQDAVRWYKRLANVERAFRSLKTVDLHVRPICHHKADRVRAHVLLCMLAYYVEWHMREALAPLLFDDEHPEEGDALRASVVAPAQSSRSAVHKAQRKRNDEGLPVQSFQSLLRDLATLAKNRVQPKTADLAAFETVTIPTLVQQRAFELLGVSYRM